MINANSVIRPDTELPPKHRLRMLDEAEIVYKTLMREATWEYMIVSALEEVSREDLNSLLNGYGGNGWYLSAVIDQQAWIFVRPKGE